MSEREKAVVRFSSGLILKGFLKDFSTESNEIFLEEAETYKLHPVRMEEVKAIFFVKSFEGDQDYRERKSYANTEPKGQRLFIKFRDGESLVGFLEGEVPWERGFYLSRRDKGPKGFYLLPADAETNNTKVFVVASSVDDVTVVPKIIGQSEAL